MDIFNPFTFAIFFHADSILSELEFYEFIQITRAFRTFLRENCISLRRVFFVVFLLSFVYAEYFHEYTDIYASVLHLYFIFILYCISAMVILVQPYL